MLSIDFIRQNPDRVQKGAIDKNVKVDIEAILKLDESSRQLQTKIQSLRHRRNTLSKGAPSHETRERGREIKEEIKSREDELIGLQDSLKEKLLLIPNLAARDVKVGRDETENEVIRTVDDPTQFDFEPRDHLTLGEKLDIIDVQSAAKVSGSRFAYLKGKAVLLEFALVQLAFSEITKEGFVPVIPPVLIREQITHDLGYWQAGGHNDYYLVKEPDIDEGQMYLVGTAEHSIVPMRRDEILDLSSPLRYIGFSTCFRREAGSYGKDTKGILRVHQFDKVEMVSFVTPDRADEEHDLLLSIEERLFQMLKIPYQVVKMCTGDLGFPAARKYDIEAWIPSQKKYREVTSTSTTTDFQSRRLKIRFKKGDTTEFAYILNGTAFAIGRTIIAILENYQLSDGTVVIPDVLQPLVGFDKIEPHV